MDLIRWGPTQEMEDFFNRFNRMMGRVPVRREPGKDVLTAAEWMPAVDVSETDKEYIIKAELPEVNKEDVKVSVRDGVLTLQGERKKETEEKGKRYHRIERSYGKFVRNFTLPDDADEGGIDAEYKKGVLTLKLKKSEKAKQKAIEVTIK